MKRKTVLVLLLAALLLTALPVAFAEEKTAAEGSAVFPAVVSAQEALRPFNRICMGEDAQGEDLLWRVVLEETNTGDAGGRLMISDDLMGGFMTWEEAKSYVPAVYETVFSEQEKAAVIETWKTDEYYIAKNLYHYAPADLEGAYTFLLSGEEADTYFPDDYSRRPGCWWLRSLFGGHWDYAGIVYWHGFLIDQNIYYGGGYATRPAFNLDLESILFVSDADWEKGGEADGVFRPVEARETEVWKLTLLDAGRSALLVSADSGDLKLREDYENESLTLSCSGLPEGEGEFVSAMLLDGTGAVLYYASIPAPGAASWTLELPEGLAAGDYRLAVYSEQQNGPYRTDYASLPSVFSLTVEAA